MLLRSSAYRLDLFVGGLLSGFHGLTGRISGAGQEENDKTECTDDSYRRKYASEGGCRFHESLPISVRRIHSPAVLNGQLDQA